MTHETRPDGDEPTAPALASRTGIARHALSRHTDTGLRRFTLEAEHLNARCLLPGSPFAEGLTLVPNHPGDKPPAVTFGPIEGEGIDAVTGLFVSPAPPERSSRLRVRVQVLDSQGERLADSELILASGESGPLTLQFEPVHDGGYRLRVEVSFEYFDGGPQQGGVEMRYLAAYSDNELMRLCNAARSDKGSETYWGGGFPHFYALTYEALFSSFRDQRFNLLEIGLDAGSHGSGRPTDAPSLRVWREFFANATLYGYDIHDFGFFGQRDTQVFRGDQSSRADIGRFLQAAGMPRFKVVLDDGSHASSHQQVSLATLFERVEPSGLYVIEDLDWQPFPEAPTTREVLLGFAQHGKIESPFISESESHRLAGAIASVELCRPNDYELAVITKKPGGTPRAWALPLAGVLRRLAARRGVARGNVSRPLP